MLCCSQRRQWLCLTDQLNPLEANKVQIWTKQLLFLLKKLSILRITSRQSDEQTQTCTQTDSFDGIQILIFEVESLGRLETIAETTSEMSFGNKRVRHFDCFAIFQSFLRSVVTLKMF